VDKPEGPAGSPETIPSRAFVSVEAGVKKRRTIPIKDQGKVDPHRADHSRATVAKAPYAGQERPKRPPTRRG